MSVKHVTDHDFEAEVIASSKPVLVDFWAPWCGPCRMMSSVVDELAEDLGDDFLVVKANVDDAPKTAARYGVQSIPTFAVIKNGELDSQLSGVQSKQNLEQALVA